MFDLPFKMASTLFSEGSKFGAHVTRETGDMFGLSPLSKKIATALEQLGSEGAQGLADFPDVLVKEGFTGAVEQGFLRFEAAGGRAVHAGVYGSVIPFAALKRERLPTALQSQNAIRGVMIVSAARDQTFSSMDAFVTALETRLQNPVDTFREAGDLQWQMESLAYAATLRLLSRGAGSIYDSRISKGALSIAHLGIGMAALRMAGSFDADAVAQYLNANAHHDYLDKALDGVGLMLAFSGGGGLRETHKIFNQLGLVSLPVLKDKGRTEFARRLKDINGGLAHGYGRGLYFTHASIGSALKTLEDGKGPLKHLDYNKVKEGIGFAYAMINAGQMDDVRKTPALLKKRDRAAVGRGIDAMIAMNQDTFPSLIA